MTQQEFISLILPLRDRLFRIAWHITRNRVEAEDIVQDVMIKIWNMDGEMKQIECPAAYCYTMAKNLAFNRLQLRTNHHDELTVGKSMAGEESPFYSVIQEEKLALLSGLMRCLPSPQDDIIQLRDIEGMSYTEIARTLALTEEQVKVYLFRARKKIKDWYLKLDNYGLQAD